MHPSDLSAPPNPEATTTPERGQLFRRSADVQLLQHGLELAALTASMGAHARRLDHLETSIADDHQLLLELRMNVDALSRELRSIADSQNNMLRLLTTHAAEESLQMSDHTKRIELLARRLIWVGALGTLIVFALARVIPPQAMAPFKALLGIG